MFLNWVKSEAKSTKLSNVGGSRVATKPERLARINLESSFKSAGKLLSSSRQLITAIIWLSIHQIWRGNFAPSNKCIPATTAHCTSSRTFQTNLTFYSRKTEKFRLAGLLIELIIISINCASEAETFAPPTRQQVPLYLSGDSPRSEFRW